MKALVLTEERRFSYREVPAPVCGADEVLVRVKACAICGSDVHGYDGSSGRRRPPVIMGHEAAGVITEVGAAVEGYRPGERVTFDSTEYCGQCAYCRRGMFNLCTDRKVLGVSCGEYRRDGAMAEYVAVKARTLYRIPSEVTFAQAAMVEPLSIAVHAVSVARLHLGERVAIVGAGTIGLMLTQAVKAAGATDLIVVDLDDAKLETARALGATCTLNPGRLNVAGEAARITGGQGVDIAFEAVGIPSTFETALSVVRPGGRLTMVGNLAQKAELPLQKCVTQQICLQGSCASSGEYGVCLDLIKHGAVDVNPLISRVAPLSEGAAWFDRLHAAEPGLIKVVLEI